MLFYPYAFLHLFGFELFLQRAGAELRIQFGKKGVGCSSSSLTQIIQREFTSLVIFYPKENI